MSSKLQVSTPSDREILMTRVFNAPRQLVWDAHTKCDLLKRWLFGPDGWELAVCEMDLRVGGKYRWMWRRDSRVPASAEWSGAPVQMAVGGVFREVAAPERLVSTEKFEEAWYPGEALNTMVLTEKDGKTTYTLRILHESKEARDTALKSGMEKGMEMGFERLDNMFAAAAAGAK